MRIKPEFCAAIREEVGRVDPAAEIWLFGSRTDDRAKGGDIDLMVRSDHLSFTDQIRLRMAILDRIGWQQLDLVVCRFDQREDPIVALALAEGIKL